MKPNKTIKKYNDKFDICVDILSGLLWREIRTHTHIIHILTTKFLSDKIITL